MQDDAQKLVISGSTAVGKCTRVSLAARAAGPPKRLRARGRHAGCLAAGAGVENAVLMQFTSAFLAGKHHESAADLGIIFVIPQDDLWSHVDWCPHSRLCWAVHLMLQQAGYQQQACKG